MFFNGTANHPMNYNMFGNSSMALASGCNSTQSSNSNSCSNNSNNNNVLPTEFIYPGYNLNHYINSNTTNNNHNNSNNNQLPIQFPGSPHDTIGFTNLRKQSSSSSALPPSSSGAVSQRAKGHHSSNSSSSSIIIDSYFLSSSSSTPAAMPHSSLHSYSESSNTSFFLPSDTSSTSHSASTISPSIDAPVASSLNTPALISTVAGSPSPSASPAMDYMLTNQNCLLVQQQQHQQHQQHQQQHYRQIQQQQQHTGSTTAQHNNNGNSNLVQQQQYLPFSTNDFQGTSSSTSELTPAVIVCSQQGPGAGQQQYTPWNIEIASSSTAASSNAQLQLTSTPFISIPAKSNSSTCTTATAVAWANESEEDGVQEQHRARQRCQQQQQQQQQQHQQLQIMTPLDSGISSMYPHISAGSHHHHHSLDLSAATAAVASMVPQPSCITPPSQQAVMSTHFQSKPQYPSAWGAPSSSPVESCFNSGTSTPSFASSMSPTLSYSSFELGSSSDSSRATSPSYHNHHQSHHHGTPYDAPFDRRHRRRDSDASSSLIIRSRKSSTSSTSSTASQRRMSTLRESTISSTAPASLPSSATTSSSVSSTTHQCPTCNLCFAGPAVLVRHIESIHDKLLWNCVGCKSNLSRRDAVTRHINLSPMDSICRAVGTIGQIKMLNGSEVHYEVSSYKAKPLDEVMNRMGKKISAALRQEIDRAKAMAEANSAAAAAAAAATTMTNGTPDPVVSNVVAMSTSHHDYGFPENIMTRLREAAVADPMAPVSNLLEMNEMVIGTGEEYEDEMMEYESDGSHKKRRRPLQHTLGQRKK